MIYSRIEPAHSESANVMNGLKDVIQAVGTDAFEDHFTTLMLSCFGVCEILVYQRSDALAPPHILISQSQAKNARERADGYQAGFFRHDPVNETLNEGPDGLYAIRVRAEEIRNAEYRTTCYTRPGISEKLTFAQKSQGAVTALNVFARDCDNGFDSAQIEDLSHFATLIMPVLSLHYRIFFGATRQKRPSVSEMEGCVSWAFPELSNREVSVCARSILGVTAEGIALDLGIKQTSVLTYRRRAYARLNVNSINQLSTMLIQSAGARQMATAC